MLLHAIIAHLVGDFLLQNHWMQRKSESSLVCTVHVLAYSLPFWGLFLMGLPGWVLAAVLVQHWLQDRFRLHVRWMRFYGQTSPEQWPAGPLFVDQSMHIAWMWLLCLIP